MNNSEQAITHVASEMTSQENKRPCTTVGTGAPVEDDYGSLKETAEKMIGKGNWTGLNPHKVLRLCMAFEHLKKDDKLVEGSNRWIPIGVRMPKSPTQYLCCDMKPDSSELPCIYVATTWSKAEGFYADNGSGKMDVRVYPTHWQPIILPGQERRELSETPVIDGEQAGGPVAGQTLVAGERTRAVTSLTWLIADARYRFDECKNNLENGSSGGYSPELTEAIGLLDELKESVTAEHGERHHDEITLKAAYLQGFEDAKKVILNTVQELSNRI